MLRCLRTDRFSLFFPLRCASRTIVSSLTGNSINPDEERSSTTQIWRGTAESVRRLIANSDSINIMVVRDPKERFLAGKWVADLTRLQEATTEEEYFKVFQHHAAPVLYPFVESSNWKEVNFQIILFDRIGEYFPDTHQGFEERKKAFKILSQKKKPRWLKKYDNYFNHWQEELDAYDFILNNKRQIEPETFIPLLNDSTYINLKGVPGKRFRQIC